MVGHSSLLKVVVVMVAGSWLSLASCTSPKPAVLRLATTTSTADSGLLEAILPVFERAYDARVDVIAVGTGQAIALGENGDADVILVHARAREEVFVADGYGTARFDVMYNDFVVVGLLDDPAGVRGRPIASQAFAAIAEAESLFASRGDESGTHTKEKSIWAETGIEPSIETGWYLSLGQGMGETLQFAHERGAYTLTDRGTYLAQRANLPGMQILFGGESIESNPDPTLRNPYGVIPVNPDRHPGIQAELAQQFVDWLTSLEVQERIGAFGVDPFGQPLFYPDSEAYRQAHPSP
jgi:tungstate transport system substrate-binding protein